jgi:hypothetical protein
VASASSLASILLDFIDVFNFNPIVLLTRLSNTRMCKLAMGNPTAPRGAMPFLTRLVVVILFSQYIRLYDSARAILVD